MKYAILNTIDRPCARLVVEIINGKAYYMARAVETGLKDYDGMSVREDTTSMEDFGFHIEERGDYVIFQHVWQSEAKYRDGTPPAMARRDVFCHGTGETGRQGKKGRNHVKIPP